MLLKEKIAQDIAGGLSALYGKETPAGQLGISETRKEFEGDFTLVVFPLLKLSGKNPEATANEIGEWLLSHTDWLDGFNVIKGFLNLELKDSALLQSLETWYSAGPFSSEPAGRRVMIEFSSPNTNKPLHLGHIRNMLLGWSVSRILEATGHEVIRTQIINDRGIAICKSMLAWQLYGEGRTPESTGIKGDHFVGDYYVLFEQKLREEYQAWQQTAEAAAVMTAKNEKNLPPEDFFKGYKNEYFNTYSSLGAQARAMLLRWENGDADTRALWRQMNGWVYDGFGETYTRMGVSFDKNYYESDTYLLGKEIVANGLESGVFYRKDDGSVWIDLEQAGLDHKVVLRSDGTSVYITQDLGTADLRYSEYGVDSMAYVVADEQNYHFQVLFETMKRMGRPYADGLYHLSYGMVELPEGRMKSREGTVVDADDLIAEVTREAAAVAAERGELEALPEAERADILHRVGLGALKYFMIKVHPRKKMIFDPKESVDMQGHTGPYIQNAYVRIRSVLRRVAAEGIAAQVLIGPGIEIHESERELILLLLQYNEVLHQAAREYDPSELANYCYALAKAYHKFYHDCPILGAADPAVRDYRVRLSGFVAETLERGMDLLGIQMPDRM